MANVIIANIRVLFKQEEKNMISYEPFWNTLEEKGISQYQLIKNYGVSAGQLSRIRANQNISTHTLNMLCKLLSCRVQDIIIYIEE